MAEIKLSLIIPAYNQETSIVEDLEKIQKAIISLNIAYEVIIVNDGSSDATYKKALTINSISPKGKVEVCSYRKNQGKGYAVKHGVNKASGDIIGFIDAGMDINPKGIPYFVNQLLKNNADIVIGSKVHTKSRITYPAFRRLSSWVYRKVCSLLFGFEASDTQVGLKIFKRKAAKEIFKKLKTKRFAFDTEILGLAQLLGYKNIIEAPVDVRFTKPGSITTANFWVVSAKMVWDSGVVFYRLKSNKYYGKIRKPNKKKLSNENSHF